MPDQTPYVFGHSEREFDRLRRQSRFVEPITRRFLLEAGISTGMRILDVGSGGGDVAVLARELVGTRGEIVGVDRSPDAVTAATARVKALAFDNVTFRMGNPAEMTFDRPFDAVIGRYVLEFQADPSSMVQKLAAHLRPGGIAFFHELDLAAAASFPPAPIHDRCMRWWNEMLRHTGADARAGLNLHRNFLAAGLPAPTMRFEAYVGGAPGCAEYLQIGVLDLMENVASEMHRLGVATAEELGLATLGERMLDEIAANGSVIVGRSEIGAWARV